MTLQEQIDIIEMVAEGLGIEPRVLKKTIDKKTLLQHALIDYGFHLAIRKQKELLEKCEEALKKTRKVLRAKSKTTTSIGGKQVLTNRAIQAAHELQFVNEALADLHAAGIGKE